MNSQGKNKNGNKGEPIPCKDCGTIFKPFLRLTNLSKGKVSSYSCSACVQARKDPRKMMWWSAKRRARDTGCAFTIKHTDIVIPERCPVLDIPLIKGTGRIIDNSPSLDKLIPELGYVPGNIAVISNRANIIKSNANSEELRRVYEWVLGHTSRRLQEEHGN